MGQYVGLKFREQGQVYFFSAAPYVVKVGDHVLVKTDEGAGLGRVVVLREEPPEGLAEEDLKPIYRPAGQEDLDTRDENDALAKEAYAFCRKCVQRHRLDMKLVDVEVYFDRSKMIFYFTAPGRVDFRELVKDLVRVYRTRIELRQIGVRHETQMLGGLGNCGQVCCCRRFLRRFEPVTIKMAKDQNLFLNPAKISGVCGRLLCCLAYEKDSYQSFQSRLPKMGKKFQTVMGQVKTLRANIFRDTLTILTEAREEVELSLDEWEQLLAGKGEPLAGGEGVQPAKLPAFAGKKSQPPRPRSSRTPRGRRPDSPPAGGRDQKPTREQKPPKEAPAPDKPAPKPERERSSTEGKDGKPDKQGQKRPQAGAPKKHRKPRKKYRGRKKSAPKAKSGEAGNK
jgi:cell fate regulator YaaT (PSP1 superfamily)